MEDYFCQLLIEHAMSHVRQTEVHTAQSLVHEPNSSEAHITTEKWERYKLLGTNHIPAELIQEAGKKHHVLRSTTFLILLGT
jgi:hypothetical protein